MATSALGVGQSYYFGTYYNNVTTAEFCDGIQSDLVAGMLNLSTYGGIFPETSTVPGQLKCTVRDVHGETVGIVTFDQVSFAKAKEQLQAAGRPFTEATLQNAIADQVAYSVIPGKQFTIILKMNYSDDSDDSTLTLVMTPGADGTLPTEENVLKVMREIYRG